MVEDYAIRIRNGRAVRVGKPFINNRGKLKWKTKYQEYFSTRMGEFTPEEWRARAMEEINAQGLEQLLEEIRQRCRKNCVWLHKETDIEEYAIECLCSRAYTHWPDFREEIMILI